VGPAPGVPGDGRGREGQRDRARDVRREPAGLPGVLLQGPVGRGAGPRLPLAHDAVRARARPHRDLQPLVLRRSTRRARAPRAARGAEAPSRAREQADLGGALRGHPRLRALHVAQRLRHPQVLPERVEGEAEGALPGAHRAAGQELEVLARRREGARRMEGLHVGLRGCHPPHRVERGAVDRGSGRQEVVREARRGGRHRRCARTPRPRVPGPGCGEEERACGGAAGAGAAPGDSRSPLRRSSVCSSCGI